MSAFITGFANELTKLATSAALGSFDRGKDSFLHGDHRIMAHNQSLPFKTEQPLPRPVQRSITPVDDPFDLGFKQLDGDIAGMDSVLNDQAVRPIE